MPTAWPPATAPAWPPAGFAALEFSDPGAVRDFAAFVGWTARSPSSAEQRAFFRDARCDDGHSVTGIVLVAPSGTFPFATCAGVDGQSVFLVLWPPFVWGSV